MLVRSWARRGCTKVGIPYHYHGSTELPVWTDPPDQERARKLEHYGRREEHRRRIGVVARAEIQLLAKAGDLSVAEIRFALSDGEYTSTRKGEWLRLTIVAKK